MCGGTFHAIARRIIRAHAESFLLPPEVSVIDPADVADVLDVLRGDHGLVGTERRAPRAGVCADIYTRCVNTPTTLAGGVAGGVSPWPPPPPPPPPPVPPPPRPPPTPPPGRLRCL